jgi:hypothetical protein
LPALSRLHTTYFEYCNIYFSCLFYFSAEMNLSA